ncbi:Helix-turn-helix protein [Xenococcus sp. PCC 7305]|uniref:helix-turn-helix domain-containing protein n=1 Tax=Xenococcus sp. PCC 7305 TaxID=102125 RepID=UPI0002AC99B3|nr:helix-turn-helix domain-containing protein [Xenococcus sp. PCC 7305]ELS05185.1 Helix-turn-helix protein [Xenococcus sp. PCC 7305]
MTYTIPITCVQCGDCTTICPTGAIQIDDNNEYWIEPGLCNGCEDIESGPLCVSSCPDNLPLPLPPKKGRYKAEAMVLNSHHIFANGHNTPISSSMVIWEACNLLAKGADSSWQTDHDGKLYFERQVKQGKGKIEFRLSENVNTDLNKTLSSQDAETVINSMDIRAACMHLIFASFATHLERPWEQEFVIDNKQLETYLGLNKRKDLSKATKLTLIKNLVQQPCRLVADIDWFRQGKIQAFSVPQDRIWHLMAIDHHFQEDEHGYKHLVGITFRIKAGMWAKYFLNKQGYKKYVAYYQYGTLPKFLLTTVMTIWHQHEGAVRMMLWLLFKTKMGKQQRITIPTLMYVAYGEAKINEASLNREKRKRLLRRFESDLEVLNHYQIKPMFDPITYPTKIQPLWARLADIPDDAEEAMEFWINDGCNETSITNSAPPGKWNLLMKARILYFELPPEWDKQLSHWENKKQRKARRQNKAKSTAHISAEQIASARKRLGISQRKLAQEIGKSQSWIRDIENSRFSPKIADIHKLRKVLELQE